MEALARRRREVGLALVCVTGSESTGKTTLARDLALHAGTIWAPEYAREYLDAKPAGLDASDVEPIARGEIALMDSHAARASRLLVLDTDLVSTCVYARHYYGHCAEWIERAARERRADLYLLLKPDVPWVADPQRDRPQQREQLHALFQAELRRVGAAYVEIGGSWEARFDRARLAVERLIVR